MTLSRVKYILVAGLLIAGIAVASLSISNTLEDKARASLSASLGAILESVDESLQEWLEHQKKTVSVWVVNDQVSALTQSLTAALARKEDLSSAPAQAAIRDLLKAQIQQEAYRGFFLVTPGGVSIGSSRDSNLGWRNLLTGRAGYLDRIFAGESVITLPQPSDVPLADENGNLVKGYPTMFVGAPVRNRQGEVIAALTFRIDPLGTFSDILKRGRSGYSGETYAFDHNGLLLSESRFRDSLAASGALAPGQTSALNIQVRDPGVNITTTAGAKPDWSGRPLTLMAESAIRSGSGQDMIGYPDYRGVPVIGVWHWYEDIGFGVATEVDFAEAYSMIRLAQTALYAMALVAGVLVLILAAYAHRNENRIIAEEKNLRRAKANAETARVEAEDANKAKSEFLSSMSHELRTPMNAILGFAQLMEIDRETPLTERQKSAVSSILKGGNHLLELIDQVLDLNKIESDRMSLSMESVSARNAIDECLNLIRGRAEEQGVEIIDRTAGGPLPMLYTDCTRFNQVLLNLLSNAVKYNRENGTVTLTCQPAANGMTRISVADTGLGIPRGGHEGLFKPFDRLGKETGIIEGTGIGLTISKKIIEALGGSIGYESEENKGSTFWIDVPLSDDQEEAESRPKTQSGPRAVKTDKAAAALLYIEDNPANLKFMESLIGQFTDLRFFSAHNAELGIDLAKQHRPDLVLMDINLPGINGIEALKELQRFEETRHIPVIAVTAAAMTRDVEAGKRAGFKAYLTKPLDVRATINTIEEWLAKEPTPT